jgi:hypothetical protein
MQGAVGALAQPARQPASHLAHEPPTTYTKIICAGQGFTIRYSRIWV